MLRLSRVLAVCSIVLLFAGAKKRTQSFPAAIDAAIAGAPKLASAFLGIQVVRLSDGHVLYQRNAEHLFTPASNTKLFTTALALGRLGPDYRFTTSVVLDGPDLVLIGRGDPSFSGRIYPYTKEPSHEDALRAMEDLADQVAAHGVKAVEGDVVGDDTRYPWVPYPAGWGADDWMWEYGAPVSALIVNDNRLDVSAVAGEAEGDLASVSIVPRFEFLTIDNRLLTGAPGGKGRIHVDGRPAAGELRLWGSVPLGGSEIVEQLALADPAEFAAAALRDALLRRGIAVRGRAVARHRFLEDVADLERGESAAPPTAPELAHRASPPLSELAQVVDKVSQNLHAEVLLREVGAVRRGMGTAEAGLAELHDFLAEVGVADEAYRIQDGSGLSRGNLVSPQAIARLLTFMAASPRSEQWQAMLPVGAEDGSLKNRFKGHPEARQIHAKTGSLSHVRALSGYAETKRYGRVAFSIMLNHYAVTDAEVTRFLDMIGLKILG